MTEGIAVEAKDTPISKKVVYYKAGTQLVQGIGKPAFVKPEGNPEIRQMSVLVTSNVERYDAASGTIETAISIYIPFVTELDK